MKFDKKRITGILLSVFFSGYVSGVIALFTIYVGPLKTSFISYVSRSDRQITDVFLKKYLYNDL